MIEIILNLKNLRLKLFGDEPVKLSLHEKGPKEVRASDIKAPSQVEIINSDLYIATLDNKKATLNMEMVVEKGRGYLPSELKAEKPEIGVIQIDSLFSPIKKVDYKVENTRVGQRTDFNKLTLEVLTDGTITPSQALKEAASILVKQFSLLSELKVKEIKAKRVKKVAKKIVKKKVVKKEKKGEKKTKKKKRSKKSAA